MLTSLLQIQPKLVIGTGGTLGRLRPACLIVFASIASDTRHGVDFELMKHHPSNHIVMMLVSSFHASSANIRSRVDAPATLSIYILSVAYLHSWSRFRPTTLLHWLTAVKPPPRLDSCCSPSTLAFSADADETIFLSPFASSLIVGPAFSASPVEPACRLIGASRSSSAPPKLIPFTCRSVAPGTPTGAPYGLPCDCIGIG